MSRPNFITPEDILRWTDAIDKDELIPSSLKSLTIIKEVCFAGLWLSEQLSELKCPDEIITRIQWTAGRLSYGRDIWEVHQQILQDYKDNKLIFEDDVDSVNN